MLKNKATYYTYSSSPDSVMATRLTASDSVSVTAAMWMIDLKWDFSMVLEDEEKEKKNSKKSYEFLKMTEAIL